jgi:hypothetical protein
LPNTATSEYSATFGQIVNGASQEKHPALLDEYSKAILFDYSYPHFYKGLWQGLFDCQSEGQN